MMALDTKPCACGRSGCVLIRPVGEFLSRWRSRKYRTNSCAKHRQNQTHGLSKDPLYRIFRGIIARCHIESATNYAYYGGKGIRVCDEWRAAPESFIAWAKASGWHKGLEVDRIETDGDYSPGNCQIVTHAVNCQKQPRNKLNAEVASAAKALLASGKSVNETRKLLGVDYGTIWHLSRGGSWRNVA